MKKIIVAAVAAIALAGCASNTPAPTVTVTAPAPVETPAPAIEPEEAFILTLEQKYGPLTNRQEEQLIDLAYDVCVSFDTIGVNQTLRLYLTQVTTRQEAKMLGYLIGAGTAAFCPEYNTKLGIGVSA